MRTKPPLTAIGGTAVFGPKLLLAALKSHAGIAKLLATDCEGLAKGRSCRHCGCVIGPEAERI